MSSMQQRGIGQGIKAVADQQERTCCSLLPYHPSLSPILLDHPFPFIRIG
uniref:Uncharacterized protein n=1 Tax=Rhizophora mucronata TaxID=61149 RepID=A0A2P2QYJ2_RHIMU